MNEYQFPEEKIWLEKCYAHAKIFIKDEHIWELEYDGDEPNPHTESIKELERYIAAIEESLKKLKE